MKLGEKIKTARLRLGWTQAKLAEKIGVSSEAVSKWECDAYKPDDANMEQLDKALGLSLLEEDGEPVNARIFNEDHMYTFLRGRLDPVRFPNANRALPFAKVKHEGAFRAPTKLGIPYIIHPLTMTCHALAMGLEDDVLLAALLLHDVCEEDPRVKPEELPVCGEAQEVVRLVTKPEDKKQYSEEAYFKAILENPKACMVKCIDRCNNVSGMALAFGPDKLKKYIRETEEWYPLLLSAVKAVPEYNNAAWLLSYQIRSILQTAKKIK